MVVNISQVTATHLKTRPLISSTGHCRDTVHKSGLWNSLMTTWEGAMVLVPAMTTRRQYFILVWCRENLCKQVELLCWISPVSPFTGMDLRLLTQAWISNYIHYKVWNETTYPFPNLNGASVEVWECISNFIQHFIMDVIIYPCWD